MIYKRSRFSPYQKECDNFIHRSLNHGMYLQLVKKSTLSHFKLEKNSTGQLSNILFQANPSEHSWQRSPSI